jgi:hypothetical protein
METITGLLYYLLMLLLTAANLLLAAVCAFRFFRHGWRGSRGVRAVSLALSLASFALAGCASLWFDSMGGGADWAILFGPATLCIAGTVPIFMMSSASEKQA